MLVKHLANWRCFPANQDRPVLLQLKIVKFCSSRKTKYLSIWLKRQIFAKNIIQTLAQKVNSLTEDVSSLALLDTYGRIVRVLEQSADESEQGKLTQQDIANRAGSSREMVSRILKDLKLGGYISIESKHINILKPLPKGW